MSDFVTFIGMPAALVVARRPDLLTFPANILFMKTKEVPGGCLAHYALYDPDLSTFVADGKRRSMAYFSQCERNNWVMIDFDYSERRWFGKKFVGGKSVGAVSGESWHDFFVHLTGLGLADGEQFKHTIEPDDGSKAS